MRASLFRTLLGIAAGLALAAAPSHAQEDEERSRFAVKGRGLAPCSALTDAYRDETPDRFLFAGWLNGYLTALQQTDPETFDLAPWQSTDFLVRYTLRYCGKNPDQPFFAAAAALATALREHRLTEPSDLILIRAEGRQGRYYQETLRQVEERLNALGLAQVDVDGTFTRESYDALKAFQRQHELEVTGLPDLPTLLKLFAPEPAAAD